KVSGMRRICSPVGSTSTCRLRVATTRAGELSCSATPACCRTSYRRRSCAGPSRRPTSHATPATGTGYPSTDPLGATTATTATRLDDVSEDEIPGLNIPAGIPLRYDLDDTTLKARKRGGDYLDPAAAQAAIETVKNQGR